MILSASRRTDIPAYYADWFFHRLAEGWLLVRNPMNPAAVKRVSLLRQDVDGIVFWSKNPAPMLPRLNLLDGYRYYFQFTLTPYGPGIEPGLPAKAEVMDTFRRLSDIIGPERVIWRYDPILFNPDYTPERHVREFADMARALGGHTRRCTISFIDSYKNTRANSESLRLIDPGDDARRWLARAFAGAAAENGIGVSACAEEIDFSGCGVGRARCVDAELFNALWGLGLSRRKAAGQRKHCGCAQSVDIGAYNTCPGGCLYCYANYSPGMIARNRSAHDSAGPALLPACSPARLP